MQVEVNYTIGESLFSEQKIRERVECLARQIVSETPGKELLVVGILNGAVIFMSDLVRCMPPELNVKMDFMSISSYGNAAKSSGTVRILKDIGSDIEGRDVLIVEDIIDTGFTLSHVKRLLLSREPKRLKVCALLDKPSRREVEIKADWTGFEIPDEFVVGYGIDFAQRNRNLPHIGKVRFAE